MNIEQARANMVEQQIRPWGVLNQTVLDILTAIPREAFTPEEWSNLAFADIEIPIGHHEIMMSPRVEARMLQALNIQPSDLCLEIGTGTGFVTACMAKLGREVDSIDIYSDFVREAQRKLKFLGIRNANISVNNLLKDWHKPHTPEYDVIAITAASLQPMPEMEQQLVIGGRLFMVVGERYPKQAWLITRQDHDVFERHVLFELDLPPLVGLVPKSEFEF